MHNRFTFKVCFSFICCRSVGRDKHVAESRTSGSATQSCLSGTSKPWMSSHAYPIIPWTEPCLSARHEPARHEPAQHHPVHDPESTPFPSWCSRPAWPVSRSGATVPRPVSRSWASVPHPTDWRPAGWNGCTWS